eukprot:TRINITY_DN16865_c0_g1_i1.p1 TRINITY_DN16865_c0_g1~~TRINITY_DN16865_c0_g1_i1.p1  ORF type:complete len:323 (+),score=47.32 TRINITY_DN16865_c0_g1_i1:46-1014(+)
MHSILLHKHKVPYTETSSWYRVPKILILFGAMLVVAYLSVIGWGTDSGTTTIGRGRNQTAASYEWGWDQTSPPNRSSLITDSLVDSGGRNLPRWEKIKKEMLSDSGDMSQPMTVVDYGANQGYFAIAIARMFSQSQVIAVESSSSRYVWNRKGTVDVLTLQAKKVRLLGISERYVVCESNIRPEFFAELRKEGVGHDYQLALSVFHWFELPDQASFEVALSNLVSNARTTFLELPHARQGVGSKYFTKWYAGRTNLSAVLSESFTSMNINCSVKQIGSWSSPDKSAELFRIDRNVEIPLPWMCHTHLSIYNCTSRFPTKCLQ